jgi:prepilin-type N-terminal cleavage/methylation domain-containing protein/prepilin-type processing-associated H-X9-DG protein
MKFVKQTTKVGLLRAFTLIELLTVLAVIAILAAVIIPTVGSVRTKAQITQSTSNLRQIGSFVNIYALDNDDELPIHVFGTDRNWIVAIWQLAYPGTTLDFTPDSQGRVLADTIFYSPLMETHKALAGETVRSYGWNIHARINFRGSADSWPRRVNVIYPNRSILVGDTTSSSAIGATNNQVNFRNNGRAAFLFADGHVDLLNPDEVSNNSNHVFWGGTILAEAGE